MRRKDAERKGARITQLLANPAYGSTPRVSREELAALYEELSVLEQHPDWAEIVGMLVSRVEARVELFELKEALKKVSNNIDMEAELPKVSERVTKALEVRTTSPFAKAIQDSIKDVMYVRKNLVRHSQFQGGDE